MFGVVLAVVSNIFSEFSSSVGKRTVNKRAVSVYTFGFIDMLLGTVFLLVLGLVRHSLVFSLASLPTLLPRLALEIVQAYVTVRAVTIAERGDFGFVRTLTIPLLLSVDIALGYVITPMQMAAMALIVLSVFVLISGEKWRVKGFWYLIFAAVNAVITISLYKYDITHFNSVEAEQSIVHIVLALFFFLSALTIARENPLRFLRQRIFLGQSISSGLSDVAGSFAYSYAPASVITAAMRASAVLFSVLSGRLYFRERHFLLRTILFILLAAGIVLIAI